MTRDERGEEHLGAHVAEEIGRGVERAPRRRAGHECRAQHLLAAEREDSFRRAVPGDVDDDEREVAALRREQVVAVTRDDTLGGAERGRDGPAVGDRPDVGLELGTQRQHDGRALLDGQAGSLRVDELLADPTAHRVDVERRAT